MAQELDLDQDLDLSQTEPPTVQLNLVQIASAPPGSALTRTTPPLPIVNGEVEIVVDTNPAIRSTRPVPHDPDLRLAQLNQLKKVVNANLSRALPPHPPTPSSWPLATGQTMPEQSVDNQYERWPMQALPFDPVPFPGEARESFPFQRNKNHSPSFQPKQPTIKWPMNIEASPRDLMIFCQASRGQQGNDPALNQGKGNALVKAETNSNPSPHYHLVHSFPFYLMSVFVQNEVVSNGSIHGHWQGVPKEIREKLSTGTPYGRMKK